MRILGLHFGSVQNVSRMLLGAALILETVFDNEGILRTLIFSTMKMEHLSSIFDFSLSVVCF